jgi:hypothetical protein
MVSVVNTQITETMSDLCCLFLSFFVVFSAQYLYTIGVGERHEVSPTEPQPRLIMTFAKDLFNYSSGHLYYNFKGERKFVARFKYSRSPFTKAKFLKELIVNHSPAEYFRKLEEERKAPLEILRETNPVWYSELLKKSC